MVDWSLPMAFFSFFGRYDLRMKLLRIQKEIFAKEEKELTKAEYARLVHAAEKKGESKIVLSHSDHMCHRNSRV